MSLQIIFLGVYYALLAIIGYDVLWKIPVRNGSFAAIVQVKKTGYFGDRSKLLRKYTGVASVDARLESAVIFYNDLLNPLASDALRNRLLVVNVHSTMQAVAFCMLAYTRCGFEPSALWLLEPVIWGMVNQFYGAAFVYPVYLLVHVYDVVGSGNATDVQPAGWALPALTLSAALGTGVPFSFLFPAFTKRCGPDVRQRAIALYRFAPAAFVAMYLFLEQITKSHRVSEIPPALPYVVAGTAAAAAHAWAIVAAGWHGGVTLVTQVFVPMKAKDPAARTGSVVADAAHLFLQWDLVVIAAAFLPFAFLQLQPVVAAESSMVLSFLDGSEIGLAAFLCATMVLLGPGAVFAFALALRIHAAI